MRLSKTAVFLAIFCESVRAQAADSLTLRHLSQTGGKGVAQKSVRRVLVDGSKLRLDQETLRNGKPAGAVSQIITPEGWWYLDHAKKAYDHLPSWRRVPGPSESFPVSGFKKGVKPVLKKSDETRTIGGIPCQVWNVVLSPGTAKVGSHCLAPAASLKLDARALEIVSEYLSLSEPTQPGMIRLASHLAGGSGKSSGPSRESRVESLSRVPIASGEFKVPAGYSRRAIFKAFGL